MADERTLQEEFYNKLREYDGTIAEIDSCTDGVIRGTIIENKLKIDNPNVPLCQAIVYLSKFRNMARDVPAHIMTIDLTKKYVRIYESKEFLSEIETSHNVSASKSNKCLITDVKPIKEYSYNENIKEVCDDLQYNEFLKVHIDFYNIVANAHRFYSENITAKTKKLEFRKELLNPQILNIYPIPKSELEIKEKTEFAGVIDCLNDKFLQKELGAFYTPLPYVKLSTQMVREAIKHILNANPNNDYIILDRCAGTGNLEQFFTDKKVKDIVLSELENYITHDLYIKYFKDKKDIIEILDKPTNEITMGELEKYKTNMSIYNYIFDNELSHCILSTYETWEWTILNAKYADKVRLIIPPEGTIDKRNSLVLGADALSEAFITGNESLNIFGNNELNDAYLKAVRQLNGYVADKNCNVILYENPPYRDTSASDNKKTNNNSSFVYQEFKKSGTDNASHRDLSNLFIWSGYKYYLTKENDFFVLYSPVKYWKSLGLSDKNFINGYLFNREYFHASPSAISCILWQNISEKKESLQLKVMDIENDNLQQIDKDNIGIIRKVYSRMQEKYKDVRKFESDIESCISLELTGYESIKSAHKKAIFNSNIIGHIRITSNNLDALSVTLTKTITYAALTQSQGFYLRSDNFEKKLPLFCAKLYPQTNWYERDVYFTTADKGNEYETDTEFLKKCLIYTCLTNRNHCISFNGSDNRFYRNELCLLQNTISDTKLQEFDLDDTDKRVIKEWGDVLQVAQQTDEYKNLLSQMPNVTLGLHQIEEEINVFEYNDKTYSKSEKPELIKSLSDKEKKLIRYKYPDLVKEIDELKQVLKEYYETEIQEKLFLYELLK